MRIVLTIFTALFLVLAADAKAGLIISHSGSSTASNSYSTNIFTGVNVTAGDYLVVAHANNKRDNGNNIISGINGLLGATAITSGDSGSTSAAWLFYQEISTTGTVDFGFETSASNNNGSHSSTYWVVSPGAGEVIAVGDTDSGAVAGAGPDPTSLDLDFSFAASASNAFAFAAVGSTNDSKLDGPPTDWSAVSNTNDFRKTYENTAVAGTSLTSTFSSTGPVNLAVAGAVFTTVAVPEPSSLFLVGIPILGMFTRRRRS